MKTTKLVLTLLATLVMLSALAMGAQFTEKWGKDLLSHPNTQAGFATLVPPVTSDVTGDGVHEVFLSLGHDHDTSDKGTVYCLDGTNGDVLWSYYSENFGSHTCLELYDVDGDGKLELLATGYHHVVMFNAEDGSILWEFTRMDNRQDKPSAILEENGVVYVFTASHQGSDGIGLQKRLGADGTLVKEVAGPLHPCHGGLSVEDLEGDGDYELVITDRDYGTGARGVQAYDTDLNLLWSHADVGCSSHLANIVNVNGDSVFDVVAMDQGDGSAGICVVDGSTGQKMTGKCDLNLGLGSHYTPAIYDIDNDGNLELVTVGLSGPTDVWDLETWSSDATLWRDEGQGWSLAKPPQMANVLHDGDMEMIFVTHGGFHVYGNMSDPGGQMDYDRYDQDTGYDGRADRMVVQDIDDDGLNEIIAIMHEAGTGTAYAFIQCLDTLGAAPTPKARTENFLYSLRRNSVSIYVAPPEGGGSPPANSPPVLAPIGDKSVYEGQLLEFTVSATDPDGDPLDYSAANLPTGASFEDQTFSWTPSQQGVYPGICFEASDGDLSDSECITITVQEMGGGGGDGKIKKLSICYKNITPEEQAFVGGHFDMVSFGRTTHDDTQGIKNANPDITILAYYNAILMRTDYSDWGEVNSHEDWFVHDKSGNRVYAPNNPSIHLMDPGSGWSDYYASQSGQFLQDYPDYGGVFADSVVWDLEEAGGSWSVPFSEFEEGILDSWSTSLMGQIETLQTTLGSRPVMPNPWKYTQFCEDITHIHVWEHFIHGPIHDINEPGYNEWYTLYTIDRMRNQSKLGNTIAAISGTKNADSNPGLAREWVNFTLACFLFAAEDMDKAYYAWNFFGDDSSDGYHSVMDYQFGEPLGDYYNVQGSVYAREFEETTVVANINATAAFTVEVGGSSYQLEPRTALIIKKGTANGGNGDENGEDDGDDGNGGSGNGGGGGEEGGIIPIPPITNLTNETNITQNFSDCGNSVKEFGEECDGIDGVMSGYRCSDECKFELIHDAPQCVVDGVCTPEEELLGFCPDCKPKCVNDGLCTDKEMAFGQCDDCVLPPVVVSEEVAGAFNWIKASAGTILLFAALALLVIFYRMWKRGTAPSIT